MNTCPTCNCTYLTTDETAHRLGISVPAVRQRAQARNIGWRIEGNVRLFKESDLAELEPPLSAG